MGPGLSPAGGTAATLACNNEPFSAVPSPMYHVTLLPTTHLILDCEQVPGIVNSDMSS